MKKRFVSAMCLLLCTALLFISCSDSDKDDSNPENSDFPSNLAEWTGDKEYKSPVALPAVSNQSESLEDLWWKKSAFYHIWIKSFKDSDVGDCSKNCGDFKGIEDSLDYIQNDLGCDAIWLSPFWDCLYKGSTNATSAALNMHGYDVNDFYKVNPYFGTGDGSNAEAELDSLIAACHARGMKIIFDFVPNHTSSNNKWFTDSASSQNGKRDWYLWNDKALDWKNTWGANAWHSKNGSYYYAAFADTQPDLNYRNYEVREEMKNVVRYWLNKGFDGLRIDAVRYLVETADSLTDTDETHAWFAELRKVIDEYESPKFMVCETWIENDRTSLNKYFGTSDAPEFNMVLDFDQGKPIVVGSSIGSAYIYYDNGNLAFTMNSTIYENPSALQSYGTFLGNHDEYIDRLGDWEGEGTSGKSILATALSLLRPTVPFIYYGNEISQKSGSQSGDFRLRQPFDWDMVTSQKSASDSVLNVNKTLLLLRRNSEYADLFENGTVKLCNSHTYTSDTNELCTNLFGYTIENGSKKILVLANVSPYYKSNIWFYSDSIPSEYSLIVGNKDTSSDITYYTDDAGYGAIEEIRT